MDKGYSIRPLSPMRRAIAARMSAAKQTIPHFRLVADMELDALIALRQRLRSCEPDVNPSITDLLIKACGTALVDVPSINVQWSEDGLRVFDTADISIVVAVEGGLATPVVRRTESKSVRDISREMKGLMSRAQAKTLKMSEISGGTVSISNLGMHGIDQFDAIINPPQCAILAVGAAKPRFVLSAEQEPRVAQVAKMTLSVDHRAVDGVQGAQFLMALKARIERPEHMSLNKWP